MKDARRVAAEALMRQEKNGYANLVLKSVLAHWKASAQEKALASAIFTELWSAWRPLIGFCSSF